MRYINRRFTYLLTYYTYISDAHYCGPSRRSSVEISGLQRELKISDFRTPLTSSSGNNNAVRACALIDPGGVRGSFIHGRVTDHGSLNNNIGIGSSISASYILRPIVAAA